MLTRRRFLKQSALASAVLAAPAIVRGQNLNSKLQLAAIGCDGKGWSDIQETAGHPQAKYVSFCDVDLARTARVHEFEKEAPIFQNYQEMLEKQNDKIDALTVSTPDHMHAKMTLELLALKKHVYCQKPLTHTVAEARKVREAARQSGMITRLGNQIHSHTFYRSAVKVVQDGVLGKIKEVRSWCNATGHGKSGYLDRPVPSQSPPSTIDWDKWIGVAPLRPYGAQDVYHPFGWRDWQDFGNGALGDFGCHIFDPVFTALGITGGPISLTADHSGMNHEVWPSQTSVKYLFHGNDQTQNQTLPVSWDDGGRLPAVGGSHVPETRALPRSGSLLIGETGSMILPHVGMPILFMVNGKPPEIEAVPSLNHYQGWVDGCLSGQQPSDGFEYGGALTEAVLLGNIAVRHKREELKWDDAAFKFTNLELANKWLTKEYRKGWELPR